MDDNSVGSYYIRHPLFRPFWDAALAEALANDTVAWAIVLETCPSDDYVRITLRRASSVDRLTSPPTVELADDVAIPAVGNQVGIEVAAELGRGPVPFAALIDSTADEHPPTWESAAFVGFENVTATQDEIVGEVSFATLEDETRLAVAEGLATTLAEVSAADPGCPENCENDSLSVLLDAYDLNADGEYEAQEILDASLFEYAIGRASLDLFFESDGDVIYWPNHDHEPDSMGTYLGFTGIAVATQ
jgi:hypothetical protein